MNGKKAINLLGLYVVVIIIYGCTNIESNSRISLDKHSSTFSQFPEEEQIIFKKIFEYKEGSSCVLKLVDSVLICMNISNTPNFQFFNFNLTTGTLSKGYVNQGRGPGELLGPMTFGTTGDLFWIYDITTKKILTADLKRVLTESTFIMKDEYPVKHYQYWIKLKDSTNYYATGFPNSSYRIQEHDLLSGEIEQEFGLFETIPNNISLPAFKSLNENFLFIRPKGNKLVLARRFEDVIEIYDTEKKILIKRIHGPEGFDAEGLIRGDDFFRNENTKISFEDGSVTNNYIYMSYSGHLANSEEAYLTQYIYIYDWNGNPIRKLTFENNIGAIAVSKDDKTIYAFDENSGYIIESNIN